MIDSHAHADFTDLNELGGELAARGITIVGQTVLPSGYVDMVATLSDGQDAILPSLGLHPWCITDSIDTELEIFANQASSTRFIGEIGLDFAERRLQACPAEKQEEVLSEILSIVSSHATADRPYVLSLHAVRSAHRVLDILEDTVAPLLGNQIRAVFHRFGGTSQDLTRIRSMGGAISVHPTMTQSKKGRAYATACERLLVESDLPEEPGSNPQEAARAIAASLESTLSHLEALGRDPREIAELSESYYHYQW